MESLQPTISDISSELTKEGLAVVRNLSLQPIADVEVEIEAVACECCGLSEDCTTEYVGHVRDKFMGKLICGLCAEAVNEEIEKKGWRREEALKEHMSACTKFNKIERVYPVLYQVEAIKHILKKTSTAGIKSVVGAAHRNGRIGRTSSCIPAITRDACDPTLVK